MNMSAVGLIYWIALLWASAAAGPNPEAYGPELCVVNTPLLTRFFTAWNEIRRVPSRGCYVAALPPPAGVASAAGHKSPHEVHVIRLVNTPPGSLTNDVRLEVMGGRHRLILVLDADLPVKWTIRATGFDPQLHHSIIVTGKSELELTDLRASLTTRPKENRTSQKNFLERLYKGAVAYSMTRVESGGNRLRLSLGTAANASAPSPAHCDQDTQGASPLVEAWRTDKQTIEGCFHAEQAGLYPKDVHVIDVGSSSAGSGPAGDGDAISDVYVHLAAADAETNESRDVALVLHSAHPVRWILSSSSRLAGSLVILAEHPVENAGISSRQSIEVRSQSLPDSFAMLILAVTADLGPPVSYVKTQSASRMELVVSKKGKQDAKQDNLSGAASHSSPSMEMGVRSLDRGYNHHTPTRGGAGRSVTWTLQQALKVHCGSHHMSASLPRPMSEALGVVAIWLSDQSCVGSRNATHWTVRTHVTSCSSTSRIDGKLTSYSNVVHIQVTPQQSDDEDFEGSGFDGYATSVGVETPGRQVTIPIQCHQEPQFPSMGGFNRMDDDNVMDTVEMPAAGQMELYHMEIHRNKEWTIPVASDMSKAQSAAEVVYDETLHVRTWIDGVSYIQIVTEKCWVSNNSDSGWPARLVLIRNTCPADISVRIRSDTKDSNGGFSFHVSKDYADMGQLYIHCKLGLCTNDPLRAQGNLKVCVDPAQHCTGRHVLKPYLEESVSTAQQILVRGPLRMVNKLSPLVAPQSNGAAGDSAASADATLATNGPPPLGPVVSSQNDGGPSAQVIVVGVSTEVTVGIALASFVIGVGLTAILWCIHMRTDPYRRVGNRKSRASRNGRCPGVKCASPMIRARNLENGQAQGVVGSQLQQQQQPLNPQQHQQQQQQQQQQYQFSYDYDISSQSNSSGSQCSREDSSPTPSSQTPMNAAL